MSTRTTTWVAAVATMALILPAAGVAQAAEQRNKIDRSAAGTERAVAPDATTLSQSRVGDLRDAFRAVLKGGQDADDVTASGSSVPESAQEPADPPIKQASTATSSLSSPLAATAAIRPLAVPSTVPTLTAPAANAAVAGNVTVSATSTAPSVRFAFLTGSTINAEVTATVTGGVATASLPSFGLAGATQIGAFDCFDECSIIGDDIAVTVSNPAPVLTAPTSGQGSWSTVALAATAGGGAVRFVVDGKSRVADTSAPFSVSYSTNGLNGGSHIVKAVQCSTNQTACDWDKPSNQRWFVVTKLKPRLSTPATFSPNGDGRFDSVWLGYTLDVASKPVLRIKNSAGSTLFGPKTLANQQSAGSHGYTWNGTMNNGQKISTGAYRVELTTSTVVANLAANGSAATTLRVDKSAPTIGGVAASSGMVYPVADGYRDTVDFKGSSSEPLKWVKATVINSNGSAIRALAITRPANSFRISWNGRTSSGRLAPAGNYRFYIEAEDYTGNRRVTSSKAITVSLKKLSARTASKVVTPKASYYGGIIGNCSAIVFPARSEWTNSLGYYSDYDFCAYYEEDYAAIGLHSVWIPPAIKYGNVKIKAYGGSATYLPEYAAMIYLDKNGDTTDYTKVFEPNDASYYGPSAPLSSLLNGQNLRWAAGTVDSDWYDIKDFTVTWTYYVLA